MVNKYKKEIKLLDTLIGSKTIEHDFRKLIIDHPEVLKCIPLLLGKYTSPIVIKIDGKNVNYIFERMTNKPDEYVKFMKATGLFDLIQNHVTSSIKDVIIGIEFGLKM